jgi:hypothetical protein
MGTPTISFTFLTLLALELVCDTHLFAQVVAEFEGTTYELQYMNYEVETACFSFLANNFTCLHFDSRRKMRDASS